MTSGILGVLIFIQVYLVPIAFAIGVIFFFYGVLNSFILSDRASVGHPYLLHSLFMFTVSLIAYGVVAGLIWLLTISPSSTPSSQGGVQVERDPSYLQAPDVPRR